MNTNRIPFNIWDDYYDEDCVPEGEIQETRGYVEEYDKFTDEQKEAATQVIYNYLKTLDLTGVEMQWDGPEIYF